ncbi:MAG: hypothetical protein ACO37C_04705, partial [Gemmobacter sp.]
MELTFEISFTGSTADDARLQFYDAAQALEGWERVISLTSHLLLNGEVRTQSPSVRGFQLVMMPPEEGSWKVIAGLSLATLEIFGNAPRDSINGW